jgi:integrase
MTRPKAFTVGDVRVRVTRPPTKRKQLWEWRAVLNRDGDRTSVWSGRATRRDATQIVSALVADGEHERQRERRVADSATRSIRDLLLAWRYAQDKRTDIAQSSKDVQRTAVRRLVKHIGDVLVERLSVATLEDYRDSSGYAGSTVQLDLGFLRVACAWGHGRGVPCPAKLPDVRINITRKYNKQTPEHGDVVAVLEHLNGWHRLAVTLLAATGARVGEIASLTWERVDIETGSLTVRGKTGVRVVPVADRSVLASLQAARQASGSLWPIPETSIRHALVVALRRACEKAKVARFTPHGLRRYVVTRLYDKGIDPGVAAELTGHSIAVAMKLYREVSPNRVRDAVRRAGLGALEPGTVTALRRAGGE